MTQNLQLMKKWFKSDEEKFQENLEKLKIQLEIKRKRFACYKNQLFLDRSFNVYMFTDIHLPHWEITYNRHLCVTYRTAGLVEGWSNSKPLDYFEDSFKALSEDRLRFLSVMGNTETLMKEKHEDFVLDKRITE